MTGWVELDPSAATGAAPPSGGGAGAPAPEDAASRARDHSVGGERGRMEEGASSSSWSTSTSSSSELEASPSTSALLVDVDRILMLHIGHRRFPAGVLSSSEFGSAATWRLTCCLRHASWIAAPQHLIVRQLLPSWSCSSRHRGHRGRAMA